MSGKMPERLCRMTDLPENGSLRLAFAADTSGHGLCVVRRNGHTYAYLNRCAHMHAPMDWQPGQFLDSAGQFIVCAMHGAHFAVEDGYCVAGPCKGQSLVPVEVAEEGGYLLLSGVGGRL